MSEILTKVRSRNIKTILAAVVCQSTGGTGDISGAGTVNELAYFTAEKTISSLPVANYPNITELSYIKGLRALPSRTLLYKSNTALSLTGTTNETQISSFLIPANTLQANDILEIWVILSKSGTAGSMTLRVNANTTDDLTGDTTLLTNTSIMTGLFSGTTRKIHILSTSSQYSFPTTSSLNDDASTVSVTGTSLSVDFTQNQYITLSIQLANSGDTATLRGWFVEIIR